MSQRLALLELTPEAQGKVETGELKVEPTRRIGRLPKEQQAAAAAETVNAVNTSPGITPFDDHRVRRSRPVLARPRRPATEPAPLALMPGRLVVRGQPTSRASTPVKVRTASAR
ncbi:hypothetical protein [Streptomyces sp. AA0539]|uniref:hypothetical protein n=1 Tax=Streptomyces sp. AA0539 TaxID=1210045 RepID=UPI003FD1B075